QFACRARCDHPTNISLVQTATINNKAGSLEETPSFAVGPSGLVVAALLRLSLRLPRAVLLSLLLRALLAKILSHSVVVDGSDLDDLASPVMDQYGIELGVDGVCRLGDRNPVRKAQVFAGRAHSYQVRIADPGPQNELILTDRLPVVVATE